MILKEYGLKLQKLREERERFLELVHSSDKRLARGEITKYQRQFTVNSITHGMSENDFLRGIEKEIDEYERLANIERSKSPAMHNILKISLGILAIVIVLLVLIIPGINMLNNKNVRQFNVLVNQTYYSGDQNTYYLENVKDAPITSLRINGTYKGEVQIYLIINNTETKYLVFNSKKYDGNIISITGNLFIVRGDPSLQGISLNGVCDETCKINVDPKTMYLQVVVGKDATVHINSIIYTQIIINTAPKQVKNIDNIVLNDLDKSVNLKGYFTDDENDTLTYALSNVPGITLSTDNTDKDVIIFHSPKDVLDNYTGFLFVSDGREKINSNVFKIIVNTKNAPKNSGSGTTQINSVPNANTNNESELPLVGTNRTLDINSNLTNRTTNETLPPSNRSINATTNIISGKGNGSLESYMDFNFKIDDKLKKIWSDDPSARPRVIVRYYSSGSQPVNYYLKALHSELNQQKQDSPGDFDKAKLIARSAELSSRIETLKEAKALASGSPVPSYITGITGQAINGYAASDVPDNSDNNILDSSDLNTLQTELDSTVKKIEVVDVYEGLQKTDKLDSLMYASDAKIEVLNANFNEIQLLRFSNQIGSVYLDEPMNSLITDSMEITKIPEAKLLKPGNLDGSNVTVCLLDTGINTEVVKNPSAGFNFISNNSNYSDDSGHGTAVGYMLYNIIPNAKLVVGKVLDNNGLGYESTIILGLQYCKDQNASIISMSLGSGGYNGYCDDNPVSQAVNELNGLGVLTIAATGNDGSNLVKVPACASGALAVGASTKDDTIANFTSYNGNTLLLAPGKDIDSVDMNGNPQVLSGTSMAVPFVTGVSAMLLQSENLSGNQNKLRLIHTGQIIETENYTFSRLDAYNVLSNNITNDMAEEGINASNGTSGIYTASACAQLENATCTYALPSGQTPCCMTAGYGTCMSQGSTQGYCHDNAKCANYAGWACTAGLYSITDVTNQMCTTAGTCSAGPLSFSAGTYYAGCSGGRVCDTSLGGNWNFTRDGYCAGTSCCNGIITSGEISTTALNWNNANENCNCGGYDGQICDNSPSIGPTDEGICVGTSCTNGAVCIHTGTYYVVPGSCSDGDYCDTSIGASNFSINGKVCSGSCNTNYNLGAGTGCTCDTQCTSGHCRADWTGGNSYCSSGATDCEHSGSSTATGQYACESQVRYTRLCTNGVWGGSSDCYGGNACAGAGGKCVRDQRVCSAGASGCVSNYTNVASGKVCSGSGSGITEVSTDNVTNYCGWTSWNGCDVTGGCVKTMQAEGCNGANVCNIASAYTNSTSISNLNVCTGGGSEGAPTQFVNCGTATSCTDGTCTGTTYYRACGGAGSCRGDNTGAASANNIYATAGYTLTGACVTTGTTLCAGSVWNGCAGVGSPNSCQKTAPAYRCTAGPGGTCTSNVGTNTSNITIGNVCSGGSEVPTSLANYCGWTGWNGCTAGAGSCGKTGQMMGCSGANVCNQASAFTNATNISNLNVCNGGGSEIAPTQFVNCGTATSCTDGTCTGTTYYRACGGAGSCRGDNTGAASLNNIYANAGFTLTGACGLSGTTNCSYSAWNGCAGSGSPNSCQKTQAIYRCTAGPSGTCTNNIGTNTSNVANGNVCDAGSETVPTTSKYCNSVTSCTAGTCTGTTYYRACDGAASCRGDNTGAASANNIFATSGNSLNGACNNQFVPCDATYRCTSATNTINTYYNDTWNPYSTQGYCNGAGTCNMSGTAQNANSTPAACECYSPGVQGNCAVGDGAACWYGGGGNLNCCGDNVSEGFNYRNIHFVSAEAGFAASAADNKCCASSHNCVYSSTCYVAGSSYDPTSVGTKTDYCYDTGTYGDWINTDYYNTWCTGAGYHWAVGYGDATGDNYAGAWGGNTSGYCNLQNYTYGAGFVASKYCCCGDDASENYLSRIGSTDAPIGFVTNGADISCCSAATKCVSGGTCVNTASANASVAPSKAYCSSGTWYGGDANVGNCTALGFNWFANSPTSTINVTNCCGDDAAGDLAYYANSSNFTGDQQINCERCNAASYLSARVLFGNGYVTGGTCYYGSITCSVAAGTNGTNCALGNKICVSNVGCNATPVVGAVTLSWTSNLTETYSATDAENDLLYNFTDWRRNGTSIAVLNMPLNSNISLTTAGAIADYSTFNNNGTLGGGTPANAPIWTSAGRVGGGYLFDGVSDYITTSKTGMSNNTGTIMLWIKPNLIDGSLRTLIDIADTGANGATLFSDGSAGNKWEFQYGNGTVVQVVGNTLTAGTWYHIAVTYDSSGAKIYQNGVKINNDTKIANINLGALSYLYIGSNAGVQRYFNGTIDEVKVYNRSLSPEQIYQEYLAGYNNDSTDIMMPNEIVAPDNWTVLVGSCDRYSCGTNTSNGVAIPATALSCGTVLSTANSNYTLAGNITINGANCLNITANNVSVDCNGYNITGNGTVGTIGIYSVANWTKILDCNISNFETGIDFKGTYNGTINNTNVSLNTSGSMYGIRIEETSYGSLNSGYNNITNSRVTVTDGTTNGEGIYLAGSKSNILTNLYIRGRTSAEIELQRGTYNTITNVNISHLNYNYAMRLAPASYNNFTNIRINGTTDYITMIDFDLNASNNILTQSIFTATLGIYGLDFEINSTNNMIYNNTFYMPSLDTNLRSLIYFGSTSSGNNTFYWNNFTATNGYYINSSNTTNTFNTTNGGHAQGNIYLGILSENVFDTDGDNYGDSGSDYPINATTLATKWSGNGSDWGPWTTNTIGCGVTLSTANTIYTLTQSININSTTCITINANNVTINCAGYNITGNNTFNTYGIYSNKANTTIKNCNITGFDTGIYYNAAIDGNIMNNNVTTITNNYVSPTYSSAIVLYNGANDNNITNNDANSTYGYGLYLNLSLNNNLTGNDVRSNSHIGIYLLSSSNNVLTKNNGTCNTGCYGIQLSSSSNCNLTSNIGSSLNQHGIYLNTANNNNLTSNRGISNSSYGIYITSSSNNTLTSNNGTSNTSNGIRLDTTSNNNTLKFNIGTSNTSNGIYIGSSLNNTLTNNTINSTTGTSLIIDTSSGLNNIYWNNFTSTSSYYINSSNTTNIFNASGPQGNIYYGISSKNVYDTNSDNWGDTGTDYPINATTWTTKWIGNGTDWGPWTTNTIGCGLTLSTANTIYTLTQSININSTTCLTINANNVTINCAGYNITGNNTFNTYGIYSNKANTTIKNCNITGFDTGIYYNAAKSGLIINNNISVTTNNVISPTYSSAIVLYNGANNNNLTNNTVNSTYGNGIYINSSSNNNILKYNNATSNTSAGIYLDASSYNNLTYNNGTSNTSFGIRVSSTSNNNNLTSNNGRSDSGIAIYIWTSSNNSLASNTGTSNSSTGIIIGSTSNSNILLLNNGTSIGDTGISISGILNNLTANRGTSKTLYGISVASAGNNLTSNIGTSNTSVGIYLTSASNNILTNNNATSNTSNGISIVTTSLNNTLTNNTINSTSGTVLYIDAGSGLNKIYWNNLSNTTTYYIDNSNSTNMFNTSVSTVEQGNIYSGISSKNVYDTNSDNWGDVGTDYPINATTWAAKWNGQGTDWGPWTTRAPPTCGATFTDNTTYTLFGNLSASGSNCFNINNLNVTINCNGYSIIGNNTIGTTGIYSANNRTAIQNCVIINFTNGILFNTTNNGTINNTYIQTTSLANTNSLYLITAKYNVLKNITISQNGDTTNAAILLQSNSSYNNFTGINATTAANSPTIYFNANCSYNRIENSKIYSTADAGVYIYNGSYNSINNTNISDGGGGYVVKLENSSDYNNLTYINMTSLNTGALRIYNGKNNNILYNQLTVTGAGANIFNINTSSNNNTITNNTFGPTSMPVLIIDATSGLNNIYWNNFTTTTGYYIVNSNSTNIFNTTVSTVAQGNIYSGILSENVYDTNSDNWGDTGTDYPINSTTWAAKWIGNGTDWGPWTTRVNVAPSITTVTVTSSSGYNVKSDNLTVTYSATDIDNDLMYNVTDWRKNGTSIAVLNMPFNTNVSSNSTGAIKDYSTNGNNGMLGGGTPANMPNWTTTGKIGGAYSFDGVGDYINISSSSSNFDFANQSFTVSVWSYYNGYSNQGSLWNCLVGRDDPFSATGYGICTQSDNQSFFYVGNLGIDSNTDIRNGWHQTVGVVDITNTNLLIYVDGILKNSRAYNYNLTNKSVAITRIGGDSGGVRFANGTIDEVKIYNRSLSADQIYADYLAGYNNESTDTLVTNETAVGDVWTASFGACDYYNNCSTNISNNLTIIHGPYVSNIMLNATSPNNLTTDNLTVYYNATDVYDDVLFNFTDWRINGTSIALLNMPFNANVSSTTAGAIADYSTFANNGTLGASTAAPNWTTAGKIGGAYSFDGINDLINFSSDIFGTGAKTICAWIYPIAWGGGSYGRIIDNGRTILYIDSTNSLVRFSSDGTYLANSTTSSITLNTWTHVCAARSATGLANMYINGILSGTANQNSGTPATGTTTLFIGNNQAQNRAFNGTIDEVKVYNRSLSPEQIYLEYVAGSSNKSTSMIARNETSKNNIWTTLVGTCDWNACSASLSNSLTVMHKPTITSAILNTTSPNNYSSDNLTLTYSATDTSTNPLFNFTDWRINGTSIAVLNMPFNENVSTTTSGAVTDYSTYGNDGQLGGGTPANSPTWNSSGKIGGAYVFDGVGDYISLGNSSSINPTQAITISAWVNLKTIPTVAATGETVVRKDSAYILYYYCQSGPNCNLDFYVYGPNYRLSYPASNFNANQWYYIAATYDMQNMKIYVNGVLVANATNNTAISSSSSIAVIGSVSAVNNYFFNGTIDEVKIYNRSLSPDQIYQENLSGSLNKSINTLVTNETLAGDVWTTLVGVCNNDSCATNTSNNITLLTVNTAFCGSILTANTVYNVTSNLASTGTCFNVTVQNITIDCNGHNITGNNATATYGLYSTVLNTTVKNCNISNFATGIYYNGADNGTIQNNTIITTKTQSGSDGMGIYLYNGASYNIINSNNITTTSGPAIYLYTSSNYNNLTSNRGISTGVWDAMRLETSCSNNVLTSNVMNNTKASSGGRGIYIVSSSNNNILTSNIGESTSYQGIMVFSSANNNTLINNNGTGAGASISGIIISVSDNNNLTGNKGTSNAYYGIEISQANYNIIRYNTGTSTNGGGIYISSSSYNNFTSNIGTGTGANAGLLVNSISNNTFINNTFRSGTGYAVDFTTSALNSTFVNNTLNSTSGHLLFIGSSSGNNIFYGNNFTQTSANYVFNVNSTNMFNTSGPIGNYYYNIESIDIYDSNSDGRGDTGTAYPLNASTWATKWTGQGTDWGPWTTKTDTAPVLQNSTILPSPAYINASLKGYCNATDADSNNVTFKYSWYLNNVLNVTNTTTQNFTQGLLTNVGNISNTSLTIGQTWILECQANDTKLWSAKVNSTAVTIIAITPSTPILVSPSNGNSTLTSRQPLLLWNSSTPVSWYEVNITSNNCASRFDNNTNMGGTTSNYTPPYNLCLQTESGANTYYNWTVRACNGQACSAWASNWNFSIQPYLAITFTTNSVTFPSMKPGDTDNTTDFSPAPLAVRNDGNIIANLTNITLNQSLFTTASYGTKYFQIKADNTTEIGSFNASASAINWANATIVNNYTIVGLGYNDSNDTAYVHLLVEVPPSEPSSTRWLSMMFNWMS